MRTIGVRALREELSQVLALVEAGEAVVVTHRGLPVARIEPYRGTAPQEVQRLLATGRVAWHGEPLEPLDAAAIGPGPAVSDILLAQRGTAPLAGDEGGATPSGDAVPGQ